MSAVSRRVWVVLGVVVAVGLVGVWYAFRQPEAQSVPPTIAELPEPDLPSPDPRLAFPTPFRNVKPGVKYVGDAKCAACHKDIDHAYHAHPMGRSAEPASRASPPERYDPAAGTTFVAGTFELKVEKGTHRVTLRDAGPSPPEYAIPVHIAIGSGTRGRSYLSARGGAVHQSPVSWFTAAGKWDLSPGFTPTMHRPITADCLFCHVNHVEPVPGSVNRYKEPVFAAQLNVGCERCHGPGELHVAERLAGATPPLPDTSIVNPKHLSPDLQLGVCQQCHLQGLERVVHRGRSQFEFRPGLPWEQFVSTVVEHPDVADPHKSVGQFEQMVKSACFTKSAGRMVCTSCHDPHAKPAPAAAAAFYRSKCLTCHETRGCVAPAADRATKADSCVACHMPKGDSANISHTAVTHHGIPRRAGADVPAGRLPPGTLPLVLFRPGEHAPPQPERDRDLAIVWAKFGLTGPFPPRWRAALSEAAGVRLDASLKQWPGDADAWGARAQVRACARDPAGRLVAARAAAHLDPRSELRLGGLVSAAAEAGDADLTLRTADALVALDPDAPTHRLTRAGVLMDRGEWERAAADCRAAVAAHPLSSLSRVSLAVCLARLGDAPAALRELDLALALAPDDRTRAEHRDFFRARAR